MAAIELFCSLVGVRPALLSKEEILIFEIDLFTRVYDELQEIYKEDEMIYENLINRLLHDILQTKEYTVSGIVNTMHVSEDVIMDVLLGRNNSPSLHLSRKIMDLHRTVRRDLYAIIIRRIRDSHF